MGNKIIIIESLSSPEQSGYRDKLVVLDAGETILHCPCSTCPNPYKPTVPRLSWQDAYGWIKYNTNNTPYNWECVITPKHDKCLLINNGGKVPTRYINKKHGDCYAVSVLIHRGWTEVWRGSAACITIHPDGWDNFINKFYLHEKGLLYISDFLNSKQ